jgi:hypothetical protein
MLSKCRLNIIRGTPVMVQWIAIVASQAAPTVVTVDGAQWLCLVLHRWQRKSLLWAKLCRMIINNQGSATVSLTVNQEDSVKQLRSCPLWHSTWGVSVLKGSNASESSHYLGAVLFDVISCTSYVRFNLVVQQCEGLRCHNQWAGECSNESVWGVCWSERNRFFFSCSNSPLWAMTSSLSRLHDHTDMRNWS